MSCQASLTGMFSWHCFQLFFFSLIVVQRHWATFYHLNKVVGTIIGQFVARSTSVVYFDSNDDCSTGEVPDDASGG